MKHVLITGATGLLGRDLTQLAKEAGHGVRAMSRRPQPEQFASPIKWVQANLETGEGLQAALENIEVIVHAATSPFSRTKAIDVQGTRRLLELARAARVEHFIFPSIVGIEKIPFSYYQYKLAAEAEVHESGVPFTIFRATQFHALLDKFLSIAARMPVLFLPVDFKYQPLEGREMALRLIECIARGPAGRIADLGGPQIHTFGEIAKLWLAAQESHRKIFRLPLPGKTAQAFHRGDNTTPQHAQGKVTWQEWVQFRYGSNYKKEK